MKIFKGREIVEAIDGSWSPKTSKGGTGGIVKNQERRLINLFTGPLMVQGGLGAEVAALKHLIQASDQSRLRNKKMTVCTDSKQLEEEFNDFV